MGEPSYPTLKLSRRIGEQWPNIEASREFSSQTLAQIQDVLVDLDSEDTNIVVLGSLGRGEFTPASDIDWYLLVDGISDPNHHALFLDAEKKIKGILAQGSRQREDIRNLRIQSRFDPQNRWGGGHEQQPNPSAAPPLRIYSRWAVGHP
jgi:predicted nucleotidyltransferase